MLDNISPAGADLTIVINDIFMLIVPRGPAIL